jgi:hypothetical protein
MVRQWRCGRPSNRTGKPCKNPVTAKGEACFRHAEEVTEITVRTTTPRSPGYLEAVKASLENVSFAQEQLNEALADALVAGHSYEELAEVLGRAVSTIYARTRPLITVKKVITRV